MCDVASCSYEIIRNTIVLLPLSAPCCEILSTQLIIHYDDALLFLPGMEFEFTQKNWPITDVPSSLVILEGKILKKKAAIFFFDDPSSFFF